MPSLDPFPHFAPFWLVFGVEEGRDVGTGLGPAFLLRLHCPLPNSPYLNRSFISEYYLLDSTCEMTESAVTTILSRSHSFQAHEAHVFLGACRLRVTSHAGHSRAVGRAPI